MSQQALIYVIVFGISFGGWAVGNWVIYRLNHKKQWQRGPSVKYTFDFLLHGALYSIPLAPAVVRCLDKTLWGKYLTRTTLTAIKRPKP